MDEHQIRKELSDVMLCVETVLSLIRKGAPLNSAEAQLILKFADTLRDAVSGDQLPCEAPSRLDAIAP
jgi:hypothetical protein